MTEEDKRIIAENFIGKTIERVGTWRTDDQVGITFHFTDGTGASWGVRASPLVVALDNGHALPAAWADDGSYPNPVEG